MKKFVAAALATGALMAGFSAQANDQLFAAEHDSRLYVFDNQDLYKSFQDMGHTAYIKARIGAAPNGGSLVFGLTGADKKKTSGIASIDLWDENVSAVNFYGEVKTEEGQLWVFQDLAEMKGALTVGEVPLRWAEIGTGPKGETVVYALNSSNKNSKPVGMINRFKSVNKMCSVYDGSGMCVLGTK